MKDPFKSAAALSPAGRAKAHRPTPTEHELLAEYEKHLREAVNAPVPPSPHPRPDHVAPEENDPAHA
jgi:hypothetical protein